MKPEEIIDRDYKAVGGGKYQHKDFTNHPNIFPYITLLCNLRGELIDQQKAEIERLKAELTKSSDALLHYSETVLNDMDIKLTEANQRGEKLNSVARNVLKEATKVYCHYNEIIKNKNESMDFKTLKELDAALSQYESTKVK